MNFDIWFNKQSRVLQVILMVIPVVGWITELLVRLSIMLRRKETIHIIVFVLFLVVGWTHILVILDLIYLIVKGHLFLAK